MSVSKEERLSALIDGEAGAFEQRRLMDELQHDAELRGRYSRYHLMGDVMRGARWQADTDLSARIQAAMADEPLEKAPFWVRQRRPLKAVGGIGVAAGVALAILVGVQFTTTSVGPDLSPVVATAPTTQPATSAPSAAAQPVASAPAGQLPWLGQESPAWASPQYSPLTQPTLTSGGIDINHQLINRYMQNHAESTMGRAPVAVSVGVPVSGGN
ncbi:sigma-E factor negative regulatory protein RseA [Ectothiorhodosinus mongolicus]|uniref:Sigma-E factor negative regulatory protein RseA n=1 Tax=Ectothiorhodosinus mongolicus TaxID=233100 RepID=A0A1R3VQR9_9GAMM|nr:sigma-E factor negative regulatory protein [Ectothiorhodosinus mongolicus]ULX56385.1 anti-sigma factor [Ectothiorhodosinus mongolicus]SIT65903.1 sigma-E factor negative regulatory protein RseA [Ectothiorhodosinus mongolicus]